MLVRVAVLSPEDVARADRDEERQDRAGDLVRRRAGPRRPASRIEPAAKATGTQNAPRSDFLGRRRRRRGGRAPESRARRRREEARSGRRPWESSSAGRRRSCAGSAPPRSGRAAGGSRRPRSGREARPPARACSRVERRIPTPIASDTASPRKKTSRRDCIEKIMSHSLGRRHPHEPSLIPFTRRTDARSLLPGSQRGPRLPLSFPYHRRNREAFRSDPRLQRGADDRRDPAAGLRGPDREGSPRRGRRLDRRHAGHPRGLGRQGGRPRDPPSAQHGEGARGLDGDPRGAGRDPDHPGRGPRVRPQRVRDPRPAHRGGPRRHRLRLALPRRARRTASRTSGTRPATGC